MRNGVTGMVAPERSAWVLSRAVLRILGEAGWRVRAAVEGPKFVAAKFGFERMVSEFTALYGLDSQSEKLKHILAAVTAEDVAPGIVGPSHEESAEPETEDGIQNLNVT
jgi:hypothetical protein